MSPRFVETLAPALSFIIALLVGLLVRRLLLRWFYQRNKDKIIFAGVFLDAVRLPSVLWCIALALQVAVWNARPGALGWSSDFIGAFLIISISLVIAAVLARMIAIYGERKKIPVAGLSRTLTYVVVLGIASAVVLGVIFKRDVTGLLTALGVGGLAIALALQDTLANFFAGIHILVEEPIVVGDAIKLSSGEEGVVRDIGWRTTRILTGGNNVVVIPNTKITSSILTNFNLPDLRAVLEITIIAAHEADPNQIAQIAMDVAAETEGVLREPPPAVFFDPGITPTHMQMKLLVTLANAAGKGEVQSAVRVGILQRFREEGVPLPSTDRTVVLRS